MAGRPTVLMVIPSLRISGGNKEVVRLLQEMVAGGDTDAVIASMWKHPHEVDTGALRVVHLLDEPPVARRALLQLPAIVRAFRWLLREVRSKQESSLWLLLGHYSTYLAAWLSPSVPRICFNQDMEWLFVPRGWRRFLLKRAILQTNRRSTVVTTNAFVTESYRREGVEALGEASIWAEPQWLTAGAEAVRDLDVLMLLRGSGIKRLDLYLEALRLFREQSSLRVAVITPDSEIAERVMHDAADVFLRPSDEAMQTLFARSRVFLLLSDVEGFGLPPLEAMGSGCIPMCRDSGGVRCYMHGEFAELLFDPDVPVERIVADVTARIQAGRLPAASTARQAFAAGLRASQVNRQRCIRLLQDTIRRV